jgi:osmoprotectant transport system permease protein
VGVQDLIDFIQLRWEQWIELAIEHLILVAVSIVLATIIGVGLGVLVYRSRTLSEFATAITATILTVPSFALFGLMLLWLGLGNTTAIVALTAYALLPIVRNTVTGLRGVDPAISESAKGMGMGSTAILLRIDLPLAWPVILAGIRVSTMLIVSIAAIAAYIGAGGLGNWIFDGLSRFGSVVAMPLIVTGAVGVVVVAFVLDFVYIGIGKLTTSRGIRD